MIEILLVIIIILLAPWLLDVALVLGIATIAIAVTIFVFIYLYENYSQQINEAMPTIISFIAISLFLKYVVMMVLLSMLLMDIMKNNKTYARIQ